MTSTRRTTYCRRVLSSVHSFFFFNDTATTDIYTLLYTLSLHDALPICSTRRERNRPRQFGATPPDFRSPTRGIHGVVPTHHKDGYGILERQSNHQFMAGTPAQPAYPAAATSAIPPGFSIMWASH